MKDLNCKADHLFTDIPRGVTSRYLREQTPPQARWLEPEQLITSETLRYDPYQPNGKILLGAIGDHLIGVADDRHILTVAGSRSGKSVNVINNLYWYDGSAFCIDPKGELSMATAERRASLGQQVGILDPFGIVSNGAKRYRIRFNPLKRLTIDNPYLIEEAQLITDGMVTSSGRENDPHWNESSSHLIMGLALHVALSPFINDADRHLPNMRDVLLNVLSVNDDQDYIVYQQVMQTVQWLQQQNIGDVATVLQGSIDGFYDKGTEERGSVLSTARRHTQFLDYRSMRDVLSGHDMDMEDMKRLPKGATIYLVLPATKMGLCNRWLRVHINQLLEAMEREPNKPKSPVLAILDEFPVLGHMQQLENAVGQIASFGVRLWVILQDWGQGEALYNKRFESFAANAGILQAFANTDLITTKYLSDRMGRTLVESNRLGDISPDQRGKGMSGRQSQRELYPLLTPDEINRTFARSDPHKRQLIMWAGYHPMILERVEYYNHPIWQSVNS